MSDNPLAECVDILVTVPELPETFPVTFPVRFPVTSPVKSPTKESAVTLAPGWKVIDSCENIPVPPESNSIFAGVVSVVVLPVAEPFNIIPFEFLL